MASLPGFCIDYWRSELGAIDEEIRKYNTPGFSGCLSRVQFNQVAPLKAALRPTNISSRVHTEGHLVESNCGANPLTIQPMSSVTDPWHADSARNVCEGVLEASQRGQQRLEMKSQ
uniref:Contactin-associated protein-like 2 n=1 Tax=Sphaerodactylus townsendi TaxID=933632 RepID=A0ACB8FTV5_9SAUR